LAAAVAEREGFAVAPGSAGVALSVDTDATGWRATIGGASSSGADFASLAAFLRGRSAAA
jgi:hypothetical protein